jgi:PAS domain S-box-containing protein
MPQLDNGVLTEPERLVSLRRARLLLASSAPIDGLVHLAVRAVVAPVGLLTFVDEDRLHIVAGHGLPARLTGVRETRRDWSFCQYVVSEDAPLAVGDARDEPALRGSPAVTELGVVAYLGHPVHDAKGHPLGSLCVVDVAPRQWSDSDIAALAEAAHLIERVIEAEGTHQELVLAAAETDAVLETALEAFIAIELTGEVIKWNRAAERTFGWDAHEAMAQCLEDLIIPERFRPAHRAAISRLAVGGTPRLLGQRLQLWALHRDGHEFPVEMTLNLVQRPQGRYAHAFVYDITERVNAERELMRERRFLQALLDSLDVGVVACDDQGHLVLFNNTMRDITGREPGGSASDAWGEGWDTRRPDGTALAAGERPLARAFAGEHVRDVEFTAQAPGGRARTFIANGQPIRDAGGARLGAVVALHEVTDRRRAQRFLECEVTVSRILEEASSIEQVGVGVLEAVARTLRWPHAELWLVDRVGHVLRNTAYWTDPRYQLSDFLPGPLPPGAGMSGRAWETNQPIWIPDISEDPSLIGRGPLAEQGLKVGLAIPVRDADGVIGVLTFFGDAAEPLEEALIAQLSGIAAHVGQFMERRRSEELAQLLARTKDEFIALVGHELRTPLTSISSYTELLLSGMDTPEDRERLLHIIARNAETLRAIIDDLLDLAGLESGYVTINKRTLDFVAVVRDVVDKHRPAADEKNLALTLAVPTGDATVSGDAARLGQVVDHVVSNAVKYTPRGGQIAVELTSDYAGVTLRVSDTGLGIPPEERERLFQRFFRASNIRNQGLPGTGLGLAISRTVLERHGGNIAVIDHDDGPGTTFVIRLPTCGS